jgi:hypothetical protein
MIYVGLQITDSFTAADFCSRSFLTFVIQSSRFHIYDL